MTSPHILNPGGVNLSQLFKRRLILISGKGGVGKTTVTVLLGLLAARLKKRTLLIEMASTERIAPFFGIEEIGHKEIPLAPYLTGINLDPQVCFEEYVIKQIKFKALFDAFVNNRFVSYFLNAVPGLNELLMIGKIYEFEKQMKGIAKKEPVYDLIIVDGPATGHGVSSFEVPSIVNKAVRVGPLHSQSQRIIDLLGDVKKTIFCAVALAEEMPVVETTELIGQIRERLAIEVGPLFLNNFCSTDIDPEEEKLLETRLPEKDHELYPYFSYALLQAKRARLHAFYEQELAQKNPDLPLIKIEHLPHYEASQKELRPLVDSLSQLFHES